MPRLMKAVRCHRFSGTDENGRPLPQPGPLRDVLSMDEIERPECAPGQVLIETHFAGLQYPDALQAQGLYQERPELPYVPGMDATGVVLEVGEGVSHVQVGEPVIAQTRIGCLAEVISVEAASVWKVPAGVHMSTCANLGRNYFAAYHSLRVIGEVEKGSLVLVDGASGGVGMAAVQLAKAMGAKVIAGVSVEEKREFPLEAGADRVFCYGSNKDTYKQFKNSVKQAAAELGQPEGVDVVVDMVQGDLFEAALVSCVRPLGKLCLVGFTAGQKPIRPGMLLIKQAAAIGSLWGPWARQHPDRHQQHVSEILGFLGSGAIVPHVGRVIEFPNFLQAFELFENNAGRSNTVIAVRAT